MVKCTRDELQTVSTKLLGKACGNLNGMEARAEYLSDHASFSSFSSKV